MVKSRSIRVAGVLCALVLSPAALGQEAPSPAYAPLGMRVGGFIAYPAVEIGAALTDNVSFSHSNPRSAIGLRVAPELAVESRWARHELRLDLESEHVIYPGESGEDTNNVNLRGGFTLDVSRDITVETSARYRLHDEAPGTAETPQGAVGRVQDESYGGAVGVTYRANRLVSQLRSSVSWYRYGDVRLADGTVESNADRDYFAPAVELRVGYDVTPAVRPFVAASYGPRIHRHEVDENGLRRDSHGIGVSAGVVLEPSSLWAGEIALRYELRDYDDPSLRTTDILGLVGDLTWRPTRLTDVTLAVGSGLNETTVAGASAIRFHSASLGVTHRLRRYLVASGDISYSINRYVGADIEEERWRGYLDLTYRLNRQMALVGSYRFILFDSSQPDSDYTENRVTVGMRLQR